MKVTQIAVGIVLTFFIVGTIMGAMYNASSDPTKTTFSRYGSYENLSQIDPNGTISQSNSNNSVSNMQYWSLKIVEELAKGETGSYNVDPATQLLNAFSTTASITISAGFLLIGIFLDGTNFIWGILTNLTYLPSPWHYFGILAVVFN